MLKKTKITKAGPTSHETTSTTVAASSSAPTTRPEPAVPIRAEGREQTATRLGPPVKAGRTLAPTPHNPAPMEPEGKKMTEGKPADGLSHDPKTPSMSGDVYEAIVRQAYEIYVRRTSLGALDDWLQAEGEILQQMKVHQPDVMQGGVYAAQELD